MPKKKLELTPEEQSEKFRAEVRRMIDAGELDPVQADEAMDDIVSRAKVK